MTIGKNRILIVLFLMTILLIIYLVNSVINTDKNKIIYIETKIDKKIYDDIILNIELSRSSPEYSRYTEAKLVNIKNKSAVIEIPLEGSFLYEIFVNYKNEKFISLSKDQIYDHFNTDVKNKFEIIEMDNKVYLLDYGLYEADETYSGTYDSYLLKDKNMFELPDSEKYMKSSNYNQFIVDPLKTDSINYFSTLPQSELQEYKFIPSDQKKIETLRAQ